MSDIHVLSEMSDILSTWDTLWKATWPALSPNMQAQAQQRVATAVPWRHGDAAIFFAMERKVKI